MIFICSLVSEGHFRYLSPLILPERERFFFKITFPYGSKALLNAKFKLMN